MRYARIENGFVAEIVVLPDDIAVEKAFHPGIVATLREAPDMVADGWSFDGKVFAAPPAPLEPSLETVKSGAMRTAIAYADQITARVTSRYPAAEVASWPTQEIEARAVQAGAGADAAPLIAALAAAAEMPLADFAVAVLAKADAYRAVVAAVQAIRDTTEAAILAASNSTEVAEALAKARQVADARAAELGVTDWPPPAHHLQLPINS